ncbi:MAG: DNA polymerase III subunit delta' [Lachnospiraceae bacterium]|nr:DNA polymerase III subunit delta' [Lachnospiraceae bacterium]
MMGGFKDIIGQDSIVKRLKSAIKNDNASHAYIFEGADGSGKKTLADIFAMALQCRSPVSSSEPCMVCESCKKVQSRSHPDIIYLAHEKPNSIGVEEIRRQLVDDILIKPYESRRKIYIIAEAEKMTVSSQNALLKTLEEPPLYAVVILLTNNISALLPTIISRCAVLRLYPLSDDIIKDYLTGRLGISEYQAEIYAGLSRGNIGRAKELAVNEGFEDIKNGAVRLLKDITPLNMGRLIGTVRLLEKDKAGTGNFLDILTLWYRDALMLKAQGEPSEISFKEELSSLRSVAESLTYENFNEIFQEIEKARSKLNSNVNFEMTMELLFLKISNITAA